MADQASKKAFPLRISNKLFEQIRSWAEQDLRSINGQIEYLLADAVRQHKRTVKSPTITDESESRGAEEV